MEEQPDSIHEEGNIEDQIKEMIEFLAKVSDENKILKSTIEGQNSKISSLESEITALKEENNSFSQKIEQNFTSANQSIDSLK